VTDPYSDEPSTAVAGEYVAKISGSAGRADTWRPSAHGHAIKQTRSVSGWLIGTMSAVAGIAGLSWWIGPAPIVAPWDVFTLLNGAYRIYEGQAPGTDFSNPIGPMVYGLAAIGMHLQRAPSLAAVTYGQVIFLAIISLLAWVVTWRRLPAPFAAAFTIFVAFLAISVRPLGYSSQVTTYAMLYNRDGWLLYATLLLLVFVGRRMPSTKRSNAADGFLLGLLLGLMFYDKITFFLASLVAVGFGLALSTLPRSPRLGAAALAGFVVIGTLMRVAFGLHTTAYISDLLEAARVQGGGSRAELLAHAIFSIAPVIVVSALLLGGLFIILKRQDASIRGIMQLSLASAYIVGSSVLISAGNADEGGNLPALVVIPLLIVVFLGPDIPRWAGVSSKKHTRPRPVTESRLLLIGLALLVVTTAGPIVGEDSLGLGQAIALHGYDAKPPATQQFDAGLLRDFVIPADAQWQTSYRTAHNLPAMINNGLDLLRKNIRPGDTVFTLAYTDPFSAALGLPLSRCGPLWWDLDFDFDRTHYPSAECAIGNADWVIIPRMIPGQGCCQETVSVMLTLYSGYLSEHYTRVQQTPDWILLRRMRIERA
jgi:hypothetical protein